MNNKETVQFLNRIYGELEGRRGALLHMLTRSGFSASSGYYNGHYSKDADGSYRKDDYPIPVISVEGLCDIEIGLSGISVSAKLSRPQALGYDYGKLSAYSFEAYGVADYVSDFYAEGMTFDQLRSNIQASQETEIGFSFALAADTQAVLPLIALLKSEGFFY